MDCDPEIFFPTYTVFRTEQIYIAGDDNISEMCHAAKNLYNQVNFEIRKVYFWNLNNPDNKEKIPKYNVLANQFKGTMNFRLLYSSTAQWVIRKVVDNWNSYFKAIKKIIDQAEVEKLTLRNEKITGIDLGVENIVAIANNIGERSIVVKGSILKSVNQFYNKIRKQLISVYDRQPVMCMLSNRKIVYDRLSSKVRLITAKRARIGINEFWKQKVQLGKKGNQNFVSIPHDKLINQIVYKANETGITVITLNEAHTSKCSFLDDESVEHHDTYRGKRIKRGLFRSATGKLINADVNGALNIIRKVFPNAFKMNPNGIAGTLTFPLRLSIKDLLNKKVFNEIPGIS